MKNKILTIIAIFALLANQLAFPYAALAIETPRTPSVPEAPQTPETSEEPDAPETPEEPDAPETPDSPQTSEEEQQEDPPVQAEQEPEQQEEQEPEQEVAAGQQDDESEQTSGVDNSGQNGDVSIETGDATVAGDITNTGNTNLVETPSTEGVQISAENSGNGADSDNDIGVVVSDESTTNQNNNADLNNNLNLESNTGKNTADKNTGGDVKVKTGDANVAGTITNVVNTNVDGVLLSEFDITDDHTGDIILQPLSGTCVTCSGIGGVSAANKDNGADSDNNIDLELSANKNTFQNNDADIENNMILAADSGNNSASKNTGGDSSIETGDANVSAGVVNIANNNLAGNVFYSVVNIFGDLVGDIILPDFNPTGNGSGSVNLANKGNGADSNNDIDVDQLDTTQIAQFNNAEIDNNIIFDANTGGNEVSANTNGDNQIETGDIAIDAQVVNVANNNIVGGKWWFVIVNQAGNWLGNIIAPDGSLVEGNIALSQGNLQTDGNGDVNITNSGNGAGSDNDAKLASANSININQTNNSKITNNINLAANTGYNTASKNTGGDSSIETGDANIMLNVLNFTNNNIIGDVYFTFVNVFGSWTGDFLAPGATKQKNIENEQKNESGIGGVADNSSNNNSSGSSSNSSSNSNSSSSDNNSSGSESSGVVAQVAAVTYHGSGSTLTGKLASGVATENKAEKVLGVNNFGDQDSNTVRVNLAYLLPLAVFLPFIRRRLPIGILLRILRRS